MIHCNSLVLRTVFVAYVCVTLAYAVPVQQRNTRQTQEDSETKLKKLHLVVETVLVSIITIILHIYLFIYLFIIVYNYI